MNKIYVQRKVEVWVEDIYYVDDLSEETLDKAVDYDLDPYDSDTLYETLIDLGPVNIYDENRNLIKQYE